MKILIPNATGPKNMGDQAILEGLLFLLNRAYPDADLTIHSFIPESYDKTELRIKPNLYFWSVFEKPGVLVRLFRIFQLGLQYLLGVLKLRLPLGEKSLLDLVDDYRNADLIIFVGGGYLRTKTGFTQSLNLLMLLSMFAFAKLFSSNVIVAPISFGPFASRWQEKLAAGVLKSLKLVSVREEVSYAILKKYHPDNLIISADQAFLLDFRPVAPKKNAEFLLGFTVRNWLNKAQQQHLQAAISDAIFNFAVNIKITVQPIVQVNSPEYGDNDIFIANEIAGDLRTRGLAVNEVIVINNLEDAILVYGKTDLLIGMRMHSNIIAATQHTPFVAIAYEHKTEGILRMYDLNQFCIDCNQVTKDNLLDLLNQVYANRMLISDKIQETESAIKIIELDRWRKILI